MTGWPLFDEGCIAVWLLLHKSGSVWLCWDFLFSSNLQVKTQENANSGGEEMDGVGRKGKRDGVRRKWDVRCFF